MRLPAPVLTTVLIALGILFPLAVRGQAAGMDAAATSTTEVSPLAPASTTEPVSPEDTSTAPTAGDSNVENASEASSADTGTAPTTARPAVADAAPVSISVSTAPIVLAKNAVITDHELWTTPGSIYVVQGTLTIDNDASLSIGAGVTVKLALDANILVNGSLTANGTAAAPIVFTSIADDSAGGDTNNDGATTDPDENRWNSLIEHAPAAAVTIDHAVFRYGGADASQAECPNIFASDSTCWNARYGTGYLSLQSGTMNVSNATFGWTAGPDLYVVRGTFTGDHLIFGSSYAMMHVFQSSEASAPEVTISRSNLDQSLTQNSVVWSPLGSPILHLSYDWWGSAAGPSPGWLTTTGNFGNPVDPITDTSPWLTSADLDGGSIGSNVLFLPGIEGSRLYDDDDKLWEPYDAETDGLFGLLTSAADRRVQKLFMDADGESVSATVHAKDGDILDTAGGTDYYAAFESSINSLVSNKIINAWKPISYDWRLSFSDLLTHGAERDGSIYYEEATDTPYIEQTLRALAASSKTGKVTIVAHSNGGMLAKALMAHLGDAETARLIDKVVFIGVPQTGTPDAIGGLLFGYKQGISALGFLPIVTAETARTLADRSPAVYGLLPSQAYFDTVQDADHPVISFSGHELFDADRAAYGSTVSSWTTLAAYLANTDGARSAPEEGNPYEAAILPTNLLGYAKATHDALDAWRPPAGVTVYQVAGWGDSSTLAGISLYGMERAGGLLSDTPMYRAITTEDGDGLVSVPSALFMDGSSTPRYWFDLAKYSTDARLAIGHSQELQIPQIRDFITNIIASNATLPSYFSTDSPPPITPNAQLRFTLHSGDGIEVVNGTGQATGISRSGIIGEHIPGSSYGELGDIQYITVPAAGTYHVSLFGTKAYAATLDVEHVDGGGSDVATITGIDATASTSASMDVDNGTPSPLTIDEDGDGTTDTSLSPDGDTSGDTPTETPPTDSSGDIDIESSVDAAATPDSPDSQTPISTGGGFTAPNVFIPGATKTSAPAATKTATTKKVAAKKTATTTPKKKTTAKAKTASTTAAKAVTQTASALASLPAAVRAEIGAALAAIASFLSMIEQLLTGTLRLL